MIRGSSELVRTWLPLRRPFIYTLSKWAVASEEVASMLGLHHHPPIYLLVS